MKGAWCHPAPPDMPRCPLPVTRPAPKSAFKEKAAGAYAPAAFGCRGTNVLRFEDGDDLMRSRIDDEDLVADQDITAASPLAEMIGTTRPRVNLFMNKFRQLGFLEYNGDMKVHC